MATEALIHPSAQLAAARVGAGVRVGALAVVGEGAVLGDGCELAAGVIVGANAVIGAGASLAEGAVVAVGVEVGDRARILAGAVVTRQVPARAIVQDHVATLVGHIDAPTDLSAPAGTQDVVVSRVKGVRLHTMREVRDMRGDLCVAEFGRDLPFVVRRSFVVYNVPNAEIRGEHAHRRCAQFLIAVAGSVHVVADDGQQRQEFCLDHPRLGLYLPPMTWGIQYRYTEGAVLLVLASDLYDADDYIRDYSEFRALANNRGAV